jgi:hypothetical protein
MCANAQTSTSHFLGELTDDTRETSYDDRATRHDVRGPFETIETVISSCAVWRAETMAENPTVAQARVMSRHGDTIATMVRSWATDGRRPYIYSYDGRSDVLLWNIPEAATGWFVFVPAAADANRASRTAARSSRSSVATAPHDGDATSRMRRGARRIARAARESVPWMQAAKPSPR